jgi:LAO/AO transport system kinase
VGVGQDEVEIVKLADLVLVVLTPDAGDEIQAFKAGIMEIADIFVINKADHPGAEKMELQLRAMLDLGLAEKDKPPVIRTVATKGKGIDGMMREVDRLLGCRDHRAQEDRRKRLLAWMLRDITREKINRIISRGIPGSVFREYVDQIYHRRSDPYTVADQLIARLKAKK